jgi:hypothetical protein
VGTLVIFAAVGAVMTIALVRAAAPEEAVPVGARPDEQRRPAIEVARDKDQRSWDRLLARSEGSRAWEAWHRAAAVLWILGTGWLALRTVAAVADGSLVGLAWGALALLWLSAAHRAVLLARRDPTPPAPWWPIRAGAAR